MKNLIKNALQRLTGQIPKGAPRRSSKWPKVEKDHLVLHPSCALCESKKDLNVHHIKPYHLFPELELEHTNLVTLCRKHHLLFGHFENWKSYNENVPTDAGDWNKRIKARPMGPKKLG